MFFGPETTKMMFRWTGVATKHILAGLIDEMTPLASHAGVGLELKHSDDLPDARADHQRVKQVIRNLIDNAIKHTPASGEVIVKAQADEDSVILTVEDTGIGIPADRVSDIFGEFTRLGTGQDDRDRGSGLGLAVSHRLTSALGGKISVDSREGEGTTFTVRFPQWPADC